MDDTTLARAARDLLATGWGRPPAAATPLGGGMNSATALVKVDGRRTVLKWVPAAAACALKSGAATARRLAQRGIRTGEPIPTLSGDLTYPHATGVVALLEYVSGDPLSADAAQDQRDVARTLAAVHATDAELRSGPFMNEVIAEMVHEVEPWIRPAVEAVLAEYRELPALTWSVLHTDPEPGAFLRERGTGRVGLIDWTGATTGPVLYDVASALMYLGGRAQADAFWETYAAHTPVPRAESTTHLPSFTRYRAAVQIAYFSMRVATGDHTGISHDAENWKGLRDGQAMLRNTGRDVGA